MDAIFTSCNSCGADFDCAHINTDDICPDCLRSKTVYRVSWTFPGVEASKLAAGLDHLKQLISEEVYWEYCELSTAEWAAVEQNEATSYHEKARNHALECITANVNGEPIEEIVARYTEHLQGLWDAGVSSGIITNTNFTNANGTWCVWPIHFSIKVDLVAAAEIESILTPGVK